MPDLATNVLYSGDNLDILRGHLALGFIGRGDLRLPDQHRPPLSVLTDP